MSLLHISIQEAYIYIDLTGVISLSLISMKSQAHTPYLFSHQAKQLFKGELSQYKPYLKKLKALNLVQYLSLRTFLIRVSEYFEQSDPDFAYFPKFVHFLLSKTKQGGFGEKNMAFPMIKGTQEDKRFFNRHIRLFVISFLKEEITNPEIGSVRANEQNNENQGGAKDQKEIDKQQDQEEKNKQYLRKEKYFQSQKDKGSQQQVNQKHKALSENFHMMSDYSTQKPAKKFEQMFYVFTQRKEQEQSKKISTKKELLEYINKLPDFENKLTINDIPHFLTSNKRALSDLLAIKLTRYYSNMLNDIKKYLERHIKTGFATYFYEEFIYQYQIYFQMQQQRTSQSITNRQQVVKEIEQQLARQFVLNPSQIKDPYKQSVFLTVWKQIHSQIHAQMATFPPPKNQELEQILLKGLTTIQLIFKFDQSQHSSTFDQQIYVNMNRKRQNYEYYADQYDTLKAHIVLCIYHELTNYLIRSIPYFNRARDSRKPFDQKKNNIVNSILQLSKSYFDCIPEYLEAKYYIINRDPAQIFDSCEKKRRKAQEIIHKYSPILTFLGKYHASLNKMQEIIGSLSYIASLSFQCGLKPQFFQQQFKKLYKYIDQLSDKQKHKKKFLESNQLDYRIILTLFSLKSVVQRWLQDEQRFPAQEYSKYLIVLKGLKVENYSTVQCSFIKYFINTIKSKCEADDQEYFPILQKYRLQIDSLQKVTYGLEKICKEVQHQRKKIEQFCSQVDQFLKEKTLKQFKRFKLKNTKSQLQILLGEQAAEKYHILFKTHQAYKKLSSFMKFSQLIAVKAVLPLFLFEHKHLQAGDILLRRIFPNLRKEGLLYSKDYEYMIKMDIKPSLRAKVGQGHSHQQEKNQKISSCFNQSKQNIEQAIFYSKQRHGISRNQAKQRVNRIKL